MVAKESVGLLWLVVELNVEVPDATRDSSGGGGTSLSPPANPVRCRPEPTRQRSFQNFFLQHNTFRYGENTEGVAYLGSQAIVLSHQVSVFTLLRYLLDHNCLAIETGATHPRVPAIASEDTVPICCILGLVSAPSGVHRPRPALSCDNCA